MPDQEWGPAYPFYERVRREAALRGMGTTELCQRSGVGRNTLGRIPHQPKPPYPETVIRLADVLGIDHEEALELAGVLPPPAPPPPGTPDIVVLHWDDRVVRRLWLLPLRDGEEQKLSMIEQHLARRSDPEENGEPESAV